MVRETKIPIRSPHVERGSVTSPWRDFYQYLVDGVDNFVTGQIIGDGAGVVGKVYYLSDTDTWSLSDRRTEATVRGMVGVCSGDGEITFCGDVPSESHGFTIGSQIYIGREGEITTDQPESGEFMKQLGTVEDADILRISVDEDYYELDTETDDDVERMSQTLGEILTTLKIINLHMSLLTDITLNKTEVE